MKLIAVGDNVVDYYQDQETFYPGGNALNVAVLASGSGMSLPISESSAMTKPRHIC